LKTKIIITLVIIIVCCTLLFSSHDDKDLIQQQLDSLSQSFDTPSNNKNLLQQFADTKKYSVFFSDKLNIYIKTKNPFLKQLNISDKKTLRKTIMMARSGSPDFTIDFIDTNIKLTSNNQATLHCTAVAKGFKSNNIIQEIMITYKKIEGTWLITQIKDIETMKVNE